MLCRKYLMRRAIIAACGYYSMALIKIPGEKTVMGIGDVGVRGVTVHTAARHLLYGCVRT